MNNGVSLSRPVHKRHRSPSLLSGTTGAEGSQPPHCEEVQAVLWKGHMGEPSWKGLLQTRLTFQRGQPCRQLHCSPCEGPDLEPLRISEIISICFQLLSFGGILLHSKYFLILGWNYLRPLLDNPEQGPSQGLNPCAPFCGLRTSQTCLNPPL